MALRIRMARGGAKKRPSYRIVVADSRSPRDGRFVEKIGTYNPLLSHDDPNRLKLDADRAKYWLGHGATPSERVGKFLGMVGVTAMPENPVRPNKAKPKAKAQERAAAAVEAAATAAEAAKAPPAEEAAAEEAPAEEAPAEEASAEEAAAEEPPSEEAAAEEAPAEEAATEETPAEEAPAEDAAADGEKKPSE